MCKTMSHIRRLAERVCHTAAMALDDDRGRHHIAAGRLRALAGHEFQARRVILTRDRHIDRAADEALFVIDEFGRCGEAARSLAKCQ